MSSSTKTTTKTPTTSPSFPCQYNPDRVYTAEQLEALDVLVHPLWIFDSVEKRMRWANQAGLELWNAKSRNELLVHRNFADMSESSIRRCEAFIVHCESTGQSILDEWTLYPKGVAKTVQMNVSIVKMSHDDDHVCLLCEAMSVHARQNDLIQNRTRGLEMLRHLPLAVCQFDMKGNVMYQNPEAMLAVDLPDVPTSSTTTTTTEDETSATTSNSSNPSVSNQNQPTEQEQLQNSDDSDDGHHQHHHQTTTNNNHHASTEIQNPNDDDDMVDHDNHDDDDGCGCGSGDHTTDENGDDNHSVTTTGTSSGSSSCSSGTAQRVREAGNLLNRFVDTNVGAWVLEQLTTAVPQQSKVDLEAVLHTRHGPKTCMIQLRHSKDPVTSEDVILFSARDNTDAHRVKQEQQAREQKSEFFAIMAHEIRTPLHQVTGFIDLLDQTELTDEQQSFVTLLKTAARGLMTVISDVLDFSKLEAGKMKLECIAFEPLSVLEGSLAAVRPSCGGDDDDDIDDENDEEGRGGTGRRSSSSRSRPQPLSVTCQYWDPNIPYRIRGDPNRLRQILLNLLSNAIKFTKQGSVTVQTIYLNGEDTDDDNNNNKTNGNHDDHYDDDHHRHHHQKQCNNTMVEGNDKNDSSGKNNQQNGNAEGKPGRTNNQNKNNNKKKKKEPMIKFMVQDTGCGMAEEHLKHIFQKYQQADASVARQYGGTGLGLSICQLLVQGMGGEIHVESELGHGSTFWFTIPTQLSSTASDDDDDDSLMEEVEHDEMVDGGEPVVVTTRQSNDDHHHHHHNHLNGKKRQKKRALGGGETDQCPSPVDTSATTTAATSTPSNTTTNKNNSLHVLVVEDNKVNQKLIANMLQRMGHTLEMAENGKMAVEMVLTKWKKEERRNNDDNNKTSNNNNDDDTNTNDDGPSSPSSSPCYDCCLMDIQMPVMDGLEATRRLRAMGCLELPIFGLTASVVRLDFQDLGFNDWITKPVPLKTLKHKLGQVVLHKNNHNNNNNNNKSRNNNDQGDSSRALASN